VRSRTWSRLITAFSAQSWASSDPQASTRTLRTDVSSSENVEPSRARTAV
jgi:hypothetical protein